MPPYAKTRELLNGTTLTFYASTFYRGTSDPAEHAAMFGPNNEHPRLMSGREAAGIAVPDLRDMSAEDILEALVARESFEMARGRNTSSHFIPLSVKKSVSSGFGKGTSTAKTFAFDIDFVLFSMSLDDKYGLAGIRSFVKMYANMPRDIFPLFTGNPAEHEVFAYTGTAIYNVAVV